MKLPKLLIGLLMLGVTACAEGYEIEVPETADGALSATPTPLVSTGAETFTMGAPSNTPRTLSGPMIVASSGSATSSTGGQSQASAGQASDEDVGESDEPTASNIEDMPLAGSPESARPLNTENSREDSGGTSASVIDDPSCNDGVRNGDETDVDCGGSCDGCLADDQEVPAATNPAPSSASEPSAAPKSCEESCTAPCFPVGLVSCCTISGQCGCTWAPGAYCL